MQQDMHVLFSSLYKERASAITDEETDSWKEISLISDQINFDNIYEKVIFLDYRDKEILPMHKRNNIYEYEEEARAF